MNEWDRQVFITETGIDPVQDADQEEGMSEIELKACPFCGARPETGRWQKHGLTVQCSSSLTDCPVCPGYSHYEPEGAVAAWNARAPQWQPIETAPKDGTFYLATNGKDQRVENCPEGHMAGIWHCIDGDWRVVSAFGDDSTHWMPLPPPPEE